MEPGWCILCSCSYGTHLLQGIIRFQATSLKMCFSLKMCRSPLLCSKVLKHAFNFMSMALEHALKWVFFLIRLTIPRWVIKSKLSLVDSYQTWLFQSIYAKKWIFAGAFLGKQARCTAQAGLCLALLSSSGLFTKKMLPASFRTQWIIQQSFITPPVLFCLLEYHPVVQHPSGFRHKACGKCRNPKGWREPFLWCWSPTNS